MSNIIIVDPYLSGNALAKAIKKTGGIDCIALHSNKTMPISYRSTFIKDDFIEEFFHDDLDQTLEWIKAFSPQTPLAVITRFRTWSNLSRKNGLPLRAFL